MVDHHHLCLSHRTLRPGTSIGTGILHLHPLNYLFLRFITVWSSLSAAHPLVHLHHITSHHLHVSLVIAYYYMYFANIHHSPANKFSPPARPTLTPSYTLSLPVRDLSSPHLSTFDTLDQPSPWLAWDLRGDRAVRAPWPTSRMTFCRR